MIELFFMILTGIVNGLFCASAGQILILYFIFILKQDTVNARNKALTLVPIVSIPTMIYYCIKANVEIKMCMILAFISIVCGLLGNVVMKKINPKILNIVSGLTLVILSAINLWRLKS